MNKRFIFHILTASLYMIIVSCSVLTAQNITAKIEEEYLKYKNAHDVEKKKMGKGHPYFGGFFQFFTPVDSPVRCFMILF